MSMVHETLGYTIGYLLYERKIPKEKVLEILRPQGELYFQVLKTRKVLSSSGQVLVQRTEEVDHDATMKLIREQYTDDWLMSQIDYVLHHPQQFRQIPAWKSHKWRKERGLDEY